MNKSIKVAISSIMLLAIFFSVALTWEACSGKSTTEKTLDQKADEAFEKYETEDDYFEDDFGDTEDNSGEESESDYTSEDEPIVDYSDYEDKGDEPAATTPVSTSPVSSSSNGRYLIVAGNFLVKDNAVDMVSRLGNMGYQGAEWAVFDYSQYYTVIASRTNNYSEAQSVSTALKRQGIDNYVHTKK